MLDGNSLGCASDGARRYECRTMLMLGESPLVSSSFTWEAQVADGVECSDAAGSARLIGDAPCFWEFLLLLPVRRVYVQYPPSTCGRTSYTCMVCIVLLLATGQVQTHVRTRPVYDAAINGHCSFTLDCKRADRTSSIKSRLHFPLIKSR